MASTHCRMSRYYREYGAMTHGSFEDPEAEKCGNPLAEHQWQRGPWLCEACTFWSSPEGRVAPRKEHAPYGPAIAQIRRVMQREGVDRDEAIRILTVRDSAEKIPGAIPGAPFRRVHVWPYRLWGDYEPSVIRCDQCQDIITFISGVIEGVGYCIGLPEDVFNGPEVRFGMTYQLTTTLVRLGYELPNRDDLQVCPITGQPASLSSLVPIGHDGKVDARTTEEGGIVLWP